MKKILYFSVVFLFASVGVFADCKNPDSRKRDSHTHEEFLSNRAALKSRSADRDPGPESSSTAPDPLFSLKIAAGFSEGRGAVLVDGKFGYIDSEGTVIIKPKFSYAGCFSEGLAVVERNKKWGFIDKSGKIVIPSRFDFALDFSEGLALVKHGTLWGYIDRTGKFAIPPRFEQAGRFSEGLANVGFYDKDYVWTSHNRPNGKWRSGFIDKTGNWVILPKLDGATGDFSGGMAMVSRNIGYNNGVISESYFIDRNGTELWILNSPYLTWFSEDALVITVGRDKAKNRDKYTFLDRRGKRLFDRTFDDLSGFSEGLAVAREGEYSGFIDKTGEYVIKPVFWSADSFSEGLAAVYKDGKRGFIDKTGDWKIEPRFDWTGYFNEGKVPVIINDKFGYTDRTGQYIWKATR